jgi:hypothetical protein
MAGAKESPCINIIIININDTATLINQVKSKDRATGPRATTGGFHLLSEISSGQIIERLDDLFTKFARVDG